MLKSSEKNQTLRSIGRAVTMPFGEFMQTMSTNPICMDYFVKYDGFHIVAIRDPFGGVQYLTKWGTPLATGSKTLRAINAYLNGLPYDERIDPRRIERSDLGGTARQVNFEFLVRRRDLLVPGSDEWEEGKAESLLDLFHGKCVAENDTLDTVAYEYGIKIFDVTFRADIPKFAKVEAAAEAYGQDMAATQIFSFKELVHFLNGCEGVVAHTGGTQSFKIKVPCPVKARIVGVKCTIPNFVGWDKILVCVENTEANAFDAVYEINLTEILTDYTRPGKGKVYANPACVKYSPARGTVVYELANGKESTSAIAPTLNALYGQIGKVPRFPPITTTATEARIRVTQPNTPSVVRCGDNRSFDLKGYEYPTKPIDIVIGVNDLWILGNGQLHLQAASMLCVPGFGPPEFMRMPYTTERTLRTAAEQRLCRDRVEYYKLVGLADGPFEDFAPMAARLFCVGL